MGVVTKIQDLDSWLVRLGVAMLSLIFISAVAVADFVTKYETAVSLLYLVPLVLAAWFSWKYAAFLLALLSGLSDAVVTCTVTRSCAAINEINAAIQSIFFLIFVYVLLALKEAQGRLRKMARTDPLTGVTNSKYFFEIGNAETHRAVRYKHPFSVAYIDVDNFKAVNDTLGHSYGNDLLCEITEKVKNAVRKTDTLARLGGDEFAILFPEEGQDEVRSAVERIQDSLLTVKVPRIGSITFSVGVITNIGRPCAFDEIITAADGLMYEAKHGGKNTVRYGIFSE